MKAKQFCKKLAVAIFSAALSFSAFVGGLPGPTTVHAGSDQTITKTDLLNYTGSVQKYTIPEDGKYIVEVVGAKGGNAGHYSAQPLTYLGGKGGYIKFTVDLKKGQTLYAYVGKAGRCDGDSGYTPAVGNGTASQGGNGAGPRSASGGGATELYLDGTNRSTNLLAVAGGGGGGSQTYQGYGFTGLDAGTSTAGNGASNGAGASASNIGGGGGGGYKGGTAGTSSTAAHGGSNYVSSRVTVNANQTSTSGGDGYVAITHMSTYQLMIDPNGGEWKGSDKVSTFTLDTTFSFSQEFKFNGQTNNYGTGVNGSIQTMTVPKTGYYYIEAYGANGGSDATSGGAGGWVKAYEYLVEGQTLYVAVGGHGGDCVPYTDCSDANAGGWNGGGRPSTTPAGGGYSGGGGGATHVALSNHGVLANYANYKNDILVVAGGGSGGSASSPGTGGQDLFAGTGASHSRVYGNGSLLTGTFGQGERAYTDGGGGGGGFYGGRKGLDAAGNSSGGGASFVNTSNNSICVGLIPNTNPYGHGYCSIKYMNDMVVLPNPTREGYDFTGWTKTGNGTVKTTVDGQTAFTYGIGLTTLTANWQKKANYGYLKVNPNGGWYGDSEGTTEVSKPVGSNYTVSQPYRYGYVFKGWTLSGDGALANGANYKFTNGTGTVTASWEKAKTTLTVDPNGGLYNGTTNKTTYANKEFGAVQSVGEPTRTGYNFQYWDETLGSDGYFGDDGWHFGTNNANLKSVWEPITYTIHYEPNCPAGLTVTGSQPDQTHTYDKSKALATNAEYNDPTGYKIKDVKFLWWNTKPDGSGITYDSGQVVKNLTAKQGDVITLYAQWMVKYTVNHYTQELDGSYKLANTDEYWLIPLTEWTTPLHEYAGFYQPEVKPLTVNTADTVINLYYDLIHYNLSYDLTGGEWYEEQPDGTWLEIAAPPSEYTVLTPDIHIVYPDKVGYDFTGWTGTDVNSVTHDVVIPKGSLGDRSFVAHWESQAYDVEVPYSLLFSVKHDGDAVGMFDQTGDGTLSEYGYMKNNSLFPVQVTSVALDGNDSFEFTNDRTLDATHPDIMNFRLDGQNGDEWNMYANELTSGTDTSKNDVFWMSQNGNGQIKFNATNAWAMHDDYDIK